MPTDFSSDKLHESDEPEKNDETWNGLTKYVAKRPGLLVLEKWIDDSLAKLEIDYEAYSTRKSLRQNFGR